MSVSFFKRHRGCDDLLLNEQICNEKFRREVWDSVCRDHGWLHAQVAPDLGNIFEMKEPHKDHLLSELHLLRDELRITPDAYAQFVGERLQRFIEEVNNETAPDFEIGFF